MVVDISHVHCTILLLSGVSVCVTYPVYDREGLCVCILPTPGNHGLVPVRVK